MTKELKTAQDRLNFFADLAERHMLETATLEGTFLQLSLIEFLRSGAMTGRSPAEMRADLLTLIPRFHNALVSADHPGVLPCIECTKRSAMQLFNEILKDIHGQVHRENSGGLN